MRTHGTLGVIVATVAVAILAVARTVDMSAQNYGDAIGKALVESMIDKDARKGWKPVAYPTDNFGVGTLYDGKGAGSFLCATATCLGTKDNSTATLKSLGFIDAGVGGSAQLNDTQKKALGLSAVLKIFSVVGLEGKFDSSKSTISDIQVPSATIRRLIKGKLTDQITAKPPTPAVTDAYKNRRLRAIVEDIVIESLTATIKLDASTAAEVKAKLDANVGKVLGKDAALGFTYNKSGEGVYQLKTSGPVIAAVAAVQQPKTGALEGNPNVNSWAGWEVDTIIPLRTDRDSAK
jgi:hypothetical protein